MTDQQKAEEIIGTPKHTMDCGSKCSYYCLAEETQIAINDTAKALTTARVEGEKTGKHRQWEKDIEALRCGIDFDGGVCPCCQANRDSIDDLEPKL